jgi:acetyl esterase/lipase
LCWTRDLLVRGGAVRPNAIGRLRQFRRRRYRACDSRGSHALHHQPDAQDWLASLAKKKSQPQTLAERRIATDAWRKWGSAEARRLYPVKVEETSIAGVRTDVITPLTMPEANRGRVLINLHGGGFVSDSGSLIEGVPIANLTKIKVVSVYYRLAPENLFPAAVDDVVAVYRELLKTYKPQSIGIFGTSAGAVLTCEVAVRLKPLGLPLPAALGAFWC